MSHVDDGALHAYLDGALDEYPAGEATRIREHLDTCPTCAARLEEETRVRGEAEAVLAAASPDVVAPPLEELRAQALAGVARRRLGALQRLGWAASVVLAMGTGWLVRGITPSGIPASAGEAETSGEADKGVGAAPSAATTAEPPAGAARSVRDEVAEPSGGVPVGGGAAGPGAVSQEVVARAPAPPIPRSGSTDARGRVGDATVAEERGANAQTEEERARDVVADVSPSLVTVADSLPSNLLDPLGVATAGEPVPMARASVGDEPVQAPTERLGVARRASELRSSPDEGPPEAPVFPEGGVGASLAVPDLRIVSVDRPTGAPPGSLRIVQLLVSGDTLEVIHLPPGADPSDPGLRQVERPSERIEPRGDGWLILRASAEGVALSDLAARIAGGS